MSVNDWKCDDNQCQIKSISEKVMDKLLVTNSKTKLGGDDFSLARGLALSLLLIDAELRTIKSKKTTFSKELRLSRQLIKNLLTEIQNNNGVNTMTHYDQVKLQVCKELFGDDFEACNIGNVKSAATKDIKIPDGKKVNFFVEKDETGRFRFKSKIVDDTPAAEKEDKPKYIAQYFYGASNTATLATTKEKARKQQQENINKIGEMFQPETKEAIEKRLKSEKQYRQAIAKAIADGFGLNN